MAPWRQRSGATDVGLGELRHGNVLGRQTDKASSHSLTHGLGWLQILPAHDASKVATQVANAAASAVQSGEIDRTMCCRLHAAVTDTASHIKAWWWHLDADLQASLKPLVDALGIKLYE